MWQCILMDITCHSMIKSSAVPCIIPTVYKAVYWEAQIVVIELSWSKSYSIDKYFFVLDIETIKNEPCVWTVWFEFFCCLVFIQKKKQADAIL